ncbi:helix-turn-helix domain-containing protein [Streptococcus sp. zg-JUN1979]|uniref:helix-turn-helix domain-containing protein n=1 Tax=Streptococcus sp. zg-JUN1979 TaxID=3391450 RepID=UPI0039A5EB94
MWDKIQLLLNERGWSVAELARRSGINYTMLADLKSGKKQDMLLGNWCKIADALDISLDEFR